LSCGGENSEGLSWSRGEAPGAGEEGQKSKKRGVATPLEVMKKRLGF